jgi:hypothetical protein
MSDRTHNVRQVFYALRYAELISQARAMLNVLNCDLLDEDAIDNSKAHMDSIEIFAGQLLDSTRKVCDF